MMVWVLMGGSDYDTSDIVGVFSTEEKANAAMPKGIQPLNARHFDDYWVEEWKVD